MSIKRQTRSLYIADMPREEVLCELFNNITHAVKPKSHKSMTIEEAKKVIEENGNFIGWLDGRKLNLYFTTVSVNVASYDENFFAGRAKKMADEVIFDLRDRILQS